MIRAGDALALLLYLNWRWFFSSIFCTSLFFLSKSKCSPGCRARSKSKPLFLIFFLCPRAAFGTSLLVFCCYPSLRLTVRCVSTLPAGLHPPACFTNNLTTVCGISLNYLKLITCNTRLALALEKEACSSLLEAERYQMRDLTNFDITRISLPTLILAVISGNWIVSIYLVSLSF